MCNMPTDADAVHRDYSYRRAQARAELEGAADVYWNNLKKIHQLVFERPTSIPGVARR